MATMKKRPTKNDRLLQIFDLYRELQGGRPCTTEEVATFALEHSLYPVPAQRDHEAYHLAWEAQLEELRTARSA